MLHPDGDTVTVPTANGLKGEFGIYDHHVFKMSSFQPFAACFWGKKKKKSLTFICCLFFLCYLWVHTFSLCVIYTDIYGYVWRYIYHIYCTQRFVFTAYIICAVILYTLSVKGNSAPVLFPSWRFVAMNLHVCVCPLFLRPKGWQQLRRDLGCTKF